MKIIFTKANRKSPKLILMRHGESNWNRDNLFTGWVDVPLSQKGIEEALKGGEKIKDIPIDLVFTSTLIRAQQTAALAMVNHSSKKTLVFLHEGKDKIAKWAEIYSPDTMKEIIPVYASWHLNERMYGKLQGLNKDATRKKFGLEQVEKWRRSYSGRPPSGESLEMTAKRTLPYFKKAILPHLRAGRNVFISAHGNSLRSIVMDLDKLTHEQVVKLEIPTGEPILYSFHNKKLVRET